MTAGLEAGASYGQVGENLTSQNPNAGGIPLPQNRTVPTPGSSAPVPSGAGPVPPSGGSPPQGGAGALPIEAAREFMPDVVPLTAPGRGLTPPPSVQAMPLDHNTVNTANLLRDWARVTKDPAIEAAARQLSQGQYRAR